MPHSWNIQGQAGQGSEQPGLVEDAPAHRRLVGLDDLYRSLPNQAILWFYEEGYASVSPQACILPVTQRWMTSSETHVNQNYADLKDFMGCISNKAQ